MKRTYVLLKGFLTVLALSAVFAGPAGASPVWKFDGEELSGSETIVGAAVESSMTIPGLTTVCDHFLYDITISNSEGTGKGQVVELPLFDCYTDTPNCTVDSIAAQKLPWPAELATIEGDDYIVIKGVEVFILYGGEECALSGTLVPVKGSAGGLIDNGIEAATFDAASFGATETELAVGSQPVEWNGVFPTEAFKWHREQALSVS